MNHWIVAPILLPLLTAIILVAAKGATLRVQRVLSLAAALASLGLAALLVSLAAEGGVQVYRLGDWPYAYGITLVLDRLSAMMVLLTAALALPSLLYAAQGADAAGRHFHALFQLQLMGINGAFLTGDLFNLFVFFEILLIASYGLLLFGGGKARSRAGIQYVVLNLAGSSLFLIAVGLIYGATGSLNMADIAVRVAAAGPEQETLLRTGAFLLVVVFGLKAAAVPLAFWLPNAYAVASAPVAALFAIMTKVGVYAILRVFTLVFGLDGVDIAGAVAAWLIPVGLATMVIGNAAAMIETRLRRQIGWLLIGSVGIMLVVVGLLDVQSIASGLYYLIHSTLLAAGLFLLADLVARQRGAASDHLQAALPIAQATFLGILFFVGATAYAGLPPFSGFLGKAIILQATREAALAPWIWTVVLVTSMFAVIGLARAGSRLFWNVLPGVSQARPASFAAVLPAILLIASSPLLVGLAGPVVEYVTATAVQIGQPHLYVEQVLGRVATGQ